MVPTTENTPVLNAANLAQFHGGFDYDFRTRSTEANHGSRELADWHAQYRSGASENDAFFYPSQATAKKLEARAPKGYVKTPTPVLKAEAQLDASKAFKKFAIHELPAAAQLEAINATVALQELFTQTNAEVNAAFDQLTETQLESAERDRQLNEQSKRIEDLTSQLAAVMKEVQSLKTPQNNPLPMPGATTTPDPAVTPDTQNQNGNYVSTATKTPAQIHVSVKALGNLTPHQKRPFQMTPNPIDDVFAYTPPTPSPGPRRFGPGDYERKSLPELLASCFCKVESAIRRFPIFNLARMNESFVRRQIIVLLQQHLGNQRLAYDVFHNKHERHWAMMAMVSHTLVDYVFKDHILGGFQGLAAECYIKAWTAEQEAARYNHAKVGDLVYRHKLAVERARCASAVVNQPGFWKWMQSLTAHNTNVIVGNLAIVFPPPCLGHVANELYKAVDEALRIAIRMLQDPTTLDISFPTTGTPWNSTFHVHRNPELIGQVLSDDRSPYCVRIACMPLIKSKSFENGKNEMTTLHRAEVIVGDRTTHLKAGRRRRN